MYFNIFRILKVKTGALQFYVYILLTVAQHYVWLCRTAIYLVVMLFKYEK